MLRDDDQDIGFEAASAWRRAQRSMKCLFDALADLDDAGGLTLAATQECWSDARVKQTIERVNLLRRMLRTEVERIRDGCDSQ